MIRHRSGEISDTFTPFLESLDQEGDSLSLARPSGVRGAPFRDAIDSRLQGVVVRILQDARERGIKVDFRTVSALAERMDSLGWSCVWCGGCFEQVDHVVPLASGGTSELTNLVPSCRDCNALKADLDVDAWVEGRTKSLAACGTITAYRRHLRRGEPTCRLCRDAAREWRNSK